MENLKFTRVRKVKAPERGTQKSVGIDFYLPNEFDSGLDFIRFEPGDSKIIPSGIHIKIPAGFCMIFFNKSSIASKQGLVLGACVVDEDFQGEIMFNLINASSVPTYVMLGQKIVQGILLPAVYSDIEEFSTLENLYPEKTKRGTGGFGSTGA